MTAKAIQEYTTIQQKVQRALPALLVHLPHMIPTSDLGWSGTVRKEELVRSNYYGISLDDLEVSGIGEELRILLGVSVRFGINDEDLIRFSFSEKYFNTWLAASK